MNPAAARVLPEPVFAELKSEQRELVAAVLERLQNSPGALLPILHGIQDELRHVPSAAVPLIAQALNVSRAEVHGVISFYHHFRSQPPGRHVLQLCRAEACQAMGARELERQLCDHLQINQHETTADGSISLEPVYCLGNCACAPSLMLDGHIHGRLTSAKLARLLDRLQLSDEEAPQ